MYEEHQQLSIPTIETYLHDSPPTADHHNSIVSKPSRFCTSRKSFNGKQKYEKLLPAKRCCSGIFFLLLPDPHSRAIHFFIVTQALWKNKPSHTAAKMNFPVIEKGPVPPRGPDPSSYHSSLPFGLILYAFIRLTEPPSCSSASKTLCLFPFSSSILENKIFIVSLAISSHGWRMVVNVG